MEINVVYIHLINQLLQYRDGSVKTFVIHIPIVRVQFLSPFFALLLSNFKLSLSLYYTLLTFTIITIVQKL